MKRGTLLLSLFLLVGCKEETATFGEKAPPLAVYQLDDKALSLDDFQGKPLLINFWSRFCGVCIVELRELAKFHQKFPEHLQILAINTDGKSEALEKLLAEENFPFTVGIDQLKITGERYQVIGTPTSFYLDQNGILKAKHESLLTKQQLYSYFQGQAQ